MLAVCIASQAHPARLTDSDSTCRTSMSSSRVARPCCTGRGGGGGSAIGRGACGQVCSAHARGACGQVCKARERIRRVDLRGGEGHVQGELGRKRGMRACGWAGSGPAGRGGRGGGGGELCGTLGRRRGCRCRPRSASGPDPAAPRPRTPPAPPPTTTRVSLLRTRATPRPSRRPSSLSLNRSPRDGGVGGVRVQPERR
jgi:hypothetical protein